MGILDSIKGLGNSVGVMSSICNKSWLQIDDSGISTTYIFKPNNQLHLTINGLSKIVPWKYFPENERLVIYYKQAEGVSYRYSFIEKGVLLTLKTDQTGGIIVLANEAAAKAPKSVGELDLYFKKRNASLISSALSDKRSPIIEKYREIAQTLDRILDGSDNQMLVEHIDYFKKNVPGFASYYRYYLNYRKYLIDKNEYEIENGYHYGLLRSAKTWNYDDMCLKLFGHFSSSECLDKYIFIVRETIDYDEATKKLLEIAKKRDAMEYRF